MEQLRQELTMKNLHGNTTPAQTGMADIGNSGPPAGADFLGQPPRLTGERMSIGDPDRIEAQITGCAIQVTPPPKSTTDDHGLARVKMDHKVFEVLCRKKRRGETVRMALERLILAG